MYTKRVKMIVNSLRRQYGLTTIPVNVNDLAKKAGVEIKFDDFDAILSGFVYQKHGSKFIGVNSQHSERRQRFTIAHELGHLFLHKSNPVNYDRAVMMFRDEHSAEGTDFKEIQANYFAAELLMPEEKIKEDISREGLLDLMDDRFIDELADKYNVSSQAMTIRLKDLYM